IILLGDGDAEDPIYAAQAANIRAGGVTISTVATDGLGMADFGTMQLIAHAGGGRFYRAQDTASVPRIFLREARTVSRSGIIEGKFFPQELSANPMVRDLRGVPPLYGYVATTPKPAGEIVLASAKLDPVLAGWQFGLGRSVAWTSDATGNWTRDWLPAPNANRFWANLVSWTFPATDSGRLFVATSSDGGEGRLTVAAPGDLGGNPVVTARVVGPDLKATTVTLVADAPHHFLGAFSANAQGAYFITVDARGAGHSQAGQVGFSVPYSAEYRTTGTNTSFLRALARAGGGSVLTSPGGAWADNVPSVFDSRSLTDLLWLLALLLLPIDIGVRRLVVTRRDLAAVRAALPFGRAQIRSAEPVAPALHTVRARRARSRGEGPVPEPKAGSGVTLGPNVPVARPQAPSSAPQGATKAPSPGPEATAEPDTTAGRLLQARKRRR
ncbi:MAG: glutamine amidotransferase, partial [Chloroflexi bacterium]|nr:glutamine amidotransferase [Chloroflexota bacterium]